MAWQTFKGITRHSMILHCHQHSVLVIWLVSQPKRVKDFVCAAVRLCLPFPCVSTPLYGPSCFLSLVHSSPSVFDLLLTWCCFPWLCYVFISPEFSLSLCPSTRLCVSLLKYIFQVSVLYWSSFILSNFYFYFTTFQSIRSYFLLHYIS